VLRWLLVVLVAVLIVRHWVWMPVLIRGESMMPTLRDGQFVGINKLAYTFSPPECGDLVALWTGREIMIKRVVGLPGEEIAMRHGEVYRNGVRLEEPYVGFNTSSEEIMPGTIEANCYVVAGDNRTGSLTMVVGRGRIVGRVFMRLKLGYRAAYCPNVSIQDSDKVRAYKS